MKKFHNPYNFVPALRRKENHDQLGDHQPVGHASYHPTHWSGRIAVTLTTETPLLILDAGKAERDKPLKGHHNFSTRIGADGLPYLPPTSIKGMLRAAYEAVTNSRLGVLEKHDQQLAYRMPANEGLKMVPARIEGNQVLLLTGSNGPSQIEPDGRPKSTNPGDRNRKNAIMHAAWLDADPANGFKNLKQWHGKKVWAYLTLWRHQRPDFDFWNVAEFFEWDANKPDDTPSEERGDWKKAWLLSGKDQGYKQGIWVEGYVCATGLNIDRKHNERIFFTSGKPISVSLTAQQNQQLRDEWKRLIEDYQRSAEEHDLVDGSLERSRHVGQADKEKDLPDGTLCYARVKENGRGGWQVTGLYPVMISRKLHQVPPVKLLPTNLLPANRIFVGPKNERSDMSPADRVFGWVVQQGNGSYKGHLRIGMTKCLVAKQEDAVQSFKTAGQQPTSVPLAILSQPKPQQVRFYVAQSEEGKALGNGMEDKGQIGYSPQNGLRGRKFYPHHAGLPVGFWDIPTQDWKRTQESLNGYFREYLRPNEPDGDDPQPNPNKTGWRLSNREKRDDQNRSIKSWIKPKTQFSFTVDVTNLSSVELGALLWLLDLPEENGKPRFHRLGGGKPLGFGSVRLVIDWGNTDLRQGEQWKKYYETLDDLPTPAPELAKDCIGKFQQEIISAYGRAEQSFYEISFIRAFLRVSEGFSDGVPTHYPRTRPSWLSADKPVPPHPKGEAFEWFVQNERPSNQKLALPDLADDHGLPILESN